MRLSKGMLPSVRHAPPLLPSEMAHEVSALFTPAAFAILAVTAGLWAASHLAVAGEIADAALLITGGILTGRAAIDVGGDLAAFMTAATGATTQQPLDDAAQHFAAAVLEGGPLLVGTLARARGEGPGRVQLAFYAPNFSWKKSRIAAHERLSVFSL